METDKLTGQDGLLVIAIADYDHWEPLGKSRDLALDLAQQLEKQGYRGEHPKCLKARDLSEALADWFTNLRRGCRTAGILHRHQRARLRRDARAAECRSSTCRCSFAVYVPAVLAL